MNIDFQYRPLPIHHGFHTSGEYERALFGAFGSGKTYAIAAEAIAWCLEQPGIRGLITRKTVPELRDTTETVFFEVLPPELRELGEIRKSGGHVSHFRFPNGSVVLFRSIDDWNKHRSLNVGFIAFDEADEFDEETYQGMLSRVRQSDPTPEGIAYGAKKITRRGVWSASNPGGHNWLWRRFVDTKSEVKNTAHWKSTSFDNPYLPPEYIESLLQYPQQWVRRYVLCQFDDFAGQIYENWGWDSHVVKLKKPEFLHKPEFWHAMDPGTRSPTACVWCVVDPDGSLGGVPRSLIAVAEYEHSYLEASKHAESWRQIERQHAPNVTWRVADPSIKTTDRGSNMELHTQYQRLGFNFALGPRTHQQRIPMLGTMIEQRRFLATENTPRLYEAIKNYQWVDLTPQQRAKGLDAPERPLKKDDHLVDCSQYITSRFVSPVKHAKENVPTDFNAEIHETIKKQIQSQQDLKGSHQPGIIV